MAALAVGLVAGCSSGATPEGGGSDDEGTKTPVDRTIALAWVANVEYGPYYIAEQEGFWKEEGINTEISPGGPNSPTGIQLVTSGQAEYAVANNIHDVAVANNDGADLVVVAAGLQRPMQSIISPADAPINSLAELQGKKLGVQATAAGALLQSAMEVQGLDPNSVEFVTVGTDAAALMDGTVDAFVGYAANHPVYLAARGFETHVLSFGEVGLPDYGDVVIVDRKFLEANREEVVSYVRGLIRGYEKNATDPEIAALLTVEEYGIDLGLELDAQIASNKVFIAAAQSPLTKEKGLMWISLDRVKDEIFPGFRVAGTLDVDSLPAPDTFIDLSVIEAAYGGKTSLL